MVEVAYPTINSAAAYNALRLTRLAGGKPVGIVGLPRERLGASASTTPGLEGQRRASIIMGVPDAAALLARHTSVRPISGLAPFRPGVVALFSGPIATKAHVVAAFGRFDPEREGRRQRGRPARATSPRRAAYTYEGGHGVGITASRQGAGGFPGPSGVTARAGRVETRFLGFRACSHGPFPARDGRPRRGASRRHLTGAVGTSEIHDGS
ncbi:MAG: hypothetical protein U0835_23740 [Isosphaeraceae bacterium]